VIYNKVLALDGINFRLLSTSKFPNPMASYLLLRNNKESGPFTVDELQNFGLKPYDLIWVQGKSAAWRYPSEIDELKPFAPAVEEQPFDRFFKKNVAEEREESKEELPAIEEKYSKYVPQPQQQAPKLSPGRSVFVTLPGNKQVNLQNDLPPKQKEDPVPPPLPTPTISITENPVAAEIKYSQPLDEIKEMYVKTLLERKDKRARKGVTLATLKKVAVFAGLVILGVLTGMVIRSRPGNIGASDALPQLMDVSAALTNKSGSDPAQSASDEKQDEVQQPGATRENENQRDYSEPKASVDESSEIKNEPTVKIRKETMIIVPKNRENYDRQQSPGVQLNALTGERDRRTRSAAAFTNEKAEGSSPAKIGNHSLRDQVTVTSNDYKRVAFGGIRNLYLTVTNKSKYALDNVVVELQYLKPSEEALRTENLNFKSIAPNESATIRVPDTNRGIKVNYRIVNIKSQETPPLVSGND
jgi:hypothetical protein